MRKQYLLYIPILLLSAVLLTGCTNKEAEYDTSKVKVVGSDEQEQAAKEPETENSAPATESSTDLGELVDPTLFSKETQSVGEVSERVFKLSAVEDSSNSGYHSITFSIASLGDIDVLPLVKVEQVLDRGVLRVTLDNISEDSSGIAFQQSKSIEKGAIGGIYHAVTSKENTSIYEVGVSGTNPFRLESEETGEGIWSVTLMVAYDLKYSAPTIDYGSTEFSSEDQSITGVTSTDGAKIMSYSYSVTGSTLRFVYSVASGTSNPVPSLTASYDEENILVVTFDSLESDKVSTWGSSITLPAGIVVDVSRSGESSTYKFTGIGGRNDFKVSASKSPNQVIVEIKL